MRFNPAVSSFVRRSPLGLAALGFVLCLHAAGDNAAAQSPAVAQAALTASSEQPRERRLRLFWQDREHDTLKWSDLYSGPEWSLDPAPAPVDRFPTLDLARQDLVQMQILDGVLLVGVRDDAGGAFQSGWVAVDTGVREHSHGDHSDWTYAPPSIAASRLDDAQGNPAHLYLYDGGLYMANDARNGFTKFVTADFSAEAPQGRFFSGGGNHITLAALRADRLLRLDRRTGPNGAASTSSISAPEGTAALHAIYLPSRHHGDPNSTAFLR